MDIETARNQSSKIRIADRDSGPFQKMLPDGPEPRTHHKPKMLSTDPPGNDLFFELFESIYDAIIIARPDGPVIRTNERARDLFCVRSSDFRGRSVTGLISGGTEQTLKWIRSNLQNQRRVFIECYCVRDDGSTFPADVTVNAIHFRDPGGELCFFVRNVTKRRQTETALKKAQEELLTVAHKAGMAEIATGVLHDVGNVVNSINVSCELIAKIAKTDTAAALVKMNGLLEEHREKLADFLTVDPKGRKLLDAYQYVGKAVHDEKNKTLKEATDLLGKIALLREVINTQQEYAKLGLFVQEVSLAEVIDDVLALQQTHLANNHIRVQKNCDESLVVATQKTKLVYILINLVQNAIDALKEKRDTADRRFLKIEAFYGYYGADEINLRVRDNGIGIPRENLTKIFNHGFSTKPTGHGFGLHTCANFMKEIGGRITVHSRGSGQGSSFILVFPVTKQKNEGGRHEAS